MCLRVARLFECVKCVNFGNRTARTVSRCNLDDGGSVCYSKRGTTES